VLWRERQVKRGGAKREGGGLAHFGKLICPVCPVVDTPVVRRLVRCVHEGVL
jgi:hypothetical protein